ncbi:MAG: tetratricopeptide repeat protein [Phycisphaerales bacterium]|nr:tetratricopeptide repeat protein [Phycisphaerales bacterium]
MNRNVLLLICIAAISCCVGCTDWLRSPEYRQPLSTGPSTVDPAAQADTLDQADALASSGDYDAALVLFHDVLEDDPTSAPAYIGIGDVHLEQGDYQQAEPAFARAAKLEPRNFNAQYGHAVSLQMLDRLVEAVRAYHRALTIKPDSPEANLNLATTYLQMEQSNHAIVFAEKAVEVDPNNGPAWVNLGVAYERVERWGDAAEAYVAASERMEPTPELMTNLLNMLVRQKRYREVVNVCDTIQKLHADAASLERKGWALFRLGDYEGSTQAYLESIGIDDTLWRAYNGLGVNALNRWLLSKEVDTEARLQALDAFRASLQINADQQKVIGLMLKYNLQR